MINPESSTSRATIAWLTAGEAPGARTLAAAQAAGYRVSFAAARGAGEPRPDIAVIDLRGDEDPCRRAADLVVRARALAPVSGTLIVVSHDLAARTRSALRRRAETIQAGADDAPVIGAVRERLRLAGLADEMGERVKSLIADGRTVSFDALAKSPGMLSVLIAGRPSPMTLGACHAVRAIAAQTSCVFSAGQVMRALDHARFDAAIFLPADEDDLLLALARALRRHHDHRRLPVLVAVETDDFADRCVARDGFDSIAARQLDGDLPVRLELAARRARMATAIRGFLRSPEGCGDGRDGAAGARFFAHHAIRQFKRADDTGQPISLIALTLATEHAAQGSGGVSRALGEAQKTITKLVRAEDMIARLSENTLILLVRGARGEDAARIAGRIEGVLSGTLLRSALAVARIRMGAIERRARDDIETSIAELMRALRESADDRRTAI